jgi:hypothetical protein
MKKTAILTVCSLAAGCAFAQTESSSSSAPAQWRSDAGGNEVSQMKARLQPKTVNDVSYICGGVGKEEVSYLKREARRHDMVLTFADARGEFLADVNVEIADAQGKPVLQTTCDGPMMVLDLPKGGRYRIHAETGGREINKVVYVPVHQQQVASAILSWPTQAAMPADTASGGGRPAGAAGTGEPMK